VHCSELPRVHLKAENRIRIRFDNSSMDTADRLGFQLVLVLFVIAVFVFSVSCAVALVVLYPRGSAKTYKPWAKNWAMHIPQQGNFVSVECDRA
jgi:hypothetical protein